MLSDPQLCSGCVQLRVASELLKVKTLIRMRGRRLVGRTCLCAITSARGGAETSGGQHTRRWSKRGPTRLWRRLAAARGAAQRSAAKRRAGGLACSLAQSVGVHPSRRDASASRRCSRALLSSRARAAAACASGGIEARAWQRASPAALAHCFAATGLLLEGWPSACLVPVRTWSPRKGFTTLQLQPQHPTAAVTVTARRSTLKCDGRSEDGPG